MEWVGPGVGHLEIGGRRRGEVASQGAAAQSASAHRAREALDNVLRKGAKSLSDFSEVRCASALLAVLKAGSLEINPTSLSAIHKSVSFPEKLKIKMETTPPPPPTHPPPAKQCKGSVHLSNQAVCVLR